MLNRLIAGILFLFACIVCQGCTEHSPPVVDKTVIQSASKGFHKFDFDNIEPLDATGFVKKADNFTIIFDPSASMTDAYIPSGACSSCHTRYQNPDVAEKHALKYGGREFVKAKEEAYYMDCNRCHQNNLYSKFHFARQLTRSINQAIPDLDYTGTLRTFGYPVYASFEYGYKTNDNTKYMLYDKQDYDRAIRKIFDADGVSPLAPTIYATGRDWLRQKGRLAVLIISDGIDMGDKAVLAAEDLKARYGEMVCIYTILIGDDPAGRVVMEKIAAAGGCGFFMNGDQLLDQGEMKKAIHEIFLTRAQPDSDGDGVSDDKDDCPGTKPGLKVDEHGCWDLVMLADVLFDFDKYNLKPEGINVLNQVVDLLNKHMFLNLHISGHTDNFGSMAYNIKLSKRRAQTGLKFLVKHGIDPARITTSWHSYSIPVATNENPAGRALNRRLEFKFKKRQD